MIPISLFYSLIRTFLTFQGRNQILSLYLQKNKTTNFIIIWKITKNSLAHPTKCLRAYVPVLQSIWVGKLQLCESHMSFSVYSQHLQVYWFTSSYGLSCLIKDTKKASDGLDKPAFRQEKQANRFEKKQCRNFLSTEVPALLRSSFIFVYGPVRYRQAKSSTVPARKYL